MKTILKRNFNMKTILKRNFNMKTILKRNFKRKWYSVRTKFVCLGIAKCSRHFLARYLT